MRGPAGASGGMLLTTAGGKDMGTRCGCWDLSGITINGGCWIGGNVVFCVWGFDRSWDELLWDEDAGFMEAIDGKGTVCLATPSESLTAATAEAPPPVGAGRNELLVDMAL